MRVLVACEFSGVVRRAFRARGHDAWSCDLLPAADGSEFHWRGDVLELLEDTRSDPEFWPPFDLMIAHPPCTYLASSGLHWNTRRPERAAQTDAAVEFVRALMNAPVRRLAIENPIGCLSTRLRKPDQIIHPWQFGHDASKATCLWLVNLPPLKPTNVLPGGRAAREPDSERPESPASVTGPVETARRNLPRHRRRDGRAMGCARRLTQANPAARACARIRVADSAVVNSATCPRMSPAFALPSLPI